MPQLTISADPDIAFEGQIAYPMLPRHVLTYFAAQVGGIPFGSLVVRAAENTVKLPGSSGDVTGLPIGFTVRQEYLEANALGYNNGQELPVMRRGYLWVLTEGAVVAEAAVFGRFAAGAGGTLLGKVRADADTASAVAIPNARFITSTTAAGYAIIEVR